MARNYANVFTAIWGREGDFVRRAAGAQRLYLMLVTQAEISACGVLPLRVRRWSALAPDVTEGDIIQSLKELEEHRFVVVDDDTEELLVRSFTRHDGGYSNPRRQPSIRDAANAIESAKLLNVLAAEFERLGLDHKWRGKASTDRLSIGKAIGDSAIPGGDAWRDEEPTKTDSDQVAHERSTESPPIGAKPQVDSHSDSQSIGNDVSTEWLTDSRRVVVTKGPYLEPTTLNPQTTTPPSVDRASPRGEDEPKTSRGTRIPTGFAVTPEMAEWGKTNAPDVHGVRETERFADYWRAQPGQKGVKTDWPATWRNWMRKAQDDARPVARASPGTNGYRGPFRNPTDPNAYTEGL